MNSTNNNFTSNDYDKLAAKYCQLEVERGKKFIPEYKQLIIDEYQKLLGYSAEDDKAIRKELNERLKKLDNQLKQIIEKANFNHINQLESK